jgi:hypothetical protein
VALPDYFKTEPGTAIVWGESGGTGVTNALPVNGISSGTGAMGAVADLGATWDQDYAVFLWAETGTAPTAQTTWVELWMACSHDNSNWPGKVTGSAASYPATVADNKLQLGRLVSFLPATNDANTVIKAQPVIWRPSARYVAPVFINLLGQTIRNQGTASSNGSRVILVPLRSLVQDTA